MGLFEFQRKDTPMTETSSKTIFHTNTIINPLSWELMGISAKECKSPIGLYGTGLKYAIAVLLRTGHSVTIQTESDTFNFSLKPLSFRGKDFDQVVCNGKDLPFTTEYGKLWEVWMAYRELVSNTIDEGGLHFAGDPFDHGTSIVVEGEAIHQCLLNHSKYFVGDREPVDECHKIRVYQGDGTIYYRGVRVGAVKDALYSYEILEDITLTEDRTIKDPFRINSIIGWSYASFLKNKELIRHVITCKKRWETDLDFDWSWSEEMTEVAQEVWETAPTSLNSSVASILKKRLKADAELSTCEPTEEQQIMITAALDFLAKAGYPVQATIKIVNNADTGNLAFVHKEQIYLTSRAFEKGLFELVTVLLEEHFHTIGFADLNRGFQTYLHEQIVTQCKKRLKIAL